MTGQSNRKKRSGFIYFLIFMIFIIWYSTRDDEQSPPSSPDLDEEIEVYVASGDPMDKAGAYAIQHRQFRPVNSLQGCYANVVGLPLCHLTRVLRKMNIHPVNDIPVQCQMMLDYECSVFEDYLF